MTPQQREQREHELTMHVFSISAAMVGVCLTGIGLLRLLATNTHVERLGDEILAADAVLFMLACVLSFWSFKTDRHLLALRRVIDGVFMLALGCMVLVCALIAYELV
ncbi:hypothetical protein [Chitiniphilus eburneus]|uniref:Uncharacterized protein n=1 Tax=Chitiniphilus eburneus TaxID=2571148 RepID=A0A4U0Q8J8_9NEIS|nr:hypothetical protein [Chitiniphilus eburneus]TJZ77597.1 hypothetical protein FAZ21_04540 [Chitiniphilus eburneus]